MGSGKSTIGRILADRLSMSWVDMDEVIENRGMKIPEIFEKYKTSVDLISTSEVSVSITVDQNDYIKDILKELSLIGSASMEANKAIICLVGQELWKDSVFIARVFKSLSSIPIRMVSLGSSDTNLSLVVPQKKSKEAVTILHKEFFE